MVVERQSTNFENDLHYVQLIYTRQCNSPWIDLMVLVASVKIHHMEKSVDVLRVNKIAISKNRDVPRMNNSLRILTFVSLLF